MVYKDTRKKKGTSKMKNINQNLMDVRFKNLKLTKIIYKDDDVGQLVEFLLQKLKTNQDWLVSSLAQRLVSGLAT